jgi:uncharacterized LabA/DUF88 family protein
MKCAVFIDGNNVFHSALSLGLKLDYAKLMDVLVPKGHELLCAYYHTGVDEKNPKQHGFRTWMKRNGFRVVEKPLETDSSGKTRANLDLEIVADMMAMADRLDTIVLVSGDGDFVYPLALLAQRGLRIEVAAFHSFGNNSASYKLMEAADKFTDLTKLQDQIRKDYPDSEDGDDFQEKPRPPAPEPLP